MKAVYIERHGTVDALKMSDVPKPSIGAEQVLVKVEAAGINASDVASVQGKFAGSVLPRIVGRDLAGKIVEGPAELIGAKVWGTGGELGIWRNGTHAEYVAIPRQAVARRPEKLSAEEAAAVGVPFVTAFSALVRLGRLKQGEWVIASGAAGAVGQAAIQIARTKGARIVALIRGDSEQQAFKSGGVEAIARSERGNLNQVVREATNGKGADLALNGVGSSIFEPLLEALAVGGRQVVYSAAQGKEATLDILSFYKNQFALFGLDTQKFGITECAGILNELAPLFESGALQPPGIAARYALSEAAEAYRRVAAGGSGRIVFVIEPGRRS
jgi:NADPH:quinone reductase